MVGFKGARLLTDRINAVTSNNGNSNSAGPRGGRGAGASAGAGGKSGGGGVVFKEFPGHHAFLGFPIQWTLNSWQTNTWPVRDDAIF